MALEACPSCGRHVRVDDEKCPFCDAARPALGATASKVLAVAATVAVGLTLSACYGGPPRRDNLTREPAQPDATSAAPDAAAAPTPSAKP